MKEKPKELQGEVKKFENAILLSSAECNYLIPLHWSQMQFNKLIQEFYTQPLLPEMVEKYFEGWREDLEDGGENCFTNNQNYIDCFSNFIEINDTQFRYVKTLSDFIDACINSSIKLEWK